ncbi:MAG: hypothetical protein JRE88_10175, partial [Deltaproteobacteria bacterium]|nr:hypothetical protein [Deltaproteobacteria bacterium]
MKNSKHVYAGQYSWQRPAAPSLALPFGVSLFFHLVLIGALIFMPEFESSPRFRSGVVNVSLVSLPSGPPAGGPAPAPAPAPAKPQPVVEKPPEKPAVEIPKPKPVPVVEKPPEAVSLAPKKTKPKTSMKKETIDRSKIIDSAI